MSESHKNDLLVASLKDLGTKMGPELLELPVQTYPVEKGNKRQPPVYTNSTGIFIRQDIWDNEPQNINVYLAHEIGHHIIRDHGVTYQFDMDTANYAEDFFINHFIKEKFGYDVKKVKSGTLYNRKYAGWSVNDIGHDLVKTPLDSRVGMCCCLGSAHPVIVRVAHNLRKRLFGATESPFFAIDSVDRKQYESVIDIAQHTKLFQPAEVTEVLQGVWEHIYLNKPVAFRKENVQLRSAESLVYLYDAKRIRHRTQGKPEEAMIAAIQFCKLCNDDAHWLAKRQAGALQRKSDIDTEVKRRNRGKKRGDKFKKQGIRQLLKLQVRANKAHARWKKEEKLTDLLIKKPVWAKEWATVRHSAPCLKTQFETVDERALPTVVHSPTTARIKTISRRAIVETNYTLESLIKTLGAFGINLSDMFGAGDMLQLPSQGRGEGNGDGEGDSLNVDAKDGGYGGGKKDDKLSESALTKGGGKQAGKSGGTAKHKEQVGEMLLNNVDMLEDILKHFKAFDSEFLKHSRHRLSDREAAASSISFDNEVVQALQSEIALLGNKKTKPLFFAKLADSSVMQTIPQTPQRKAIVVALDGSGSMRGEYYKVAAGFSLAMLKHLAKDGRPMGVLNFSHTVIQAFVHTGKGKVNWAEVLNVICNPTYGGTSFKAALQASMDISHTMKWTQTKTILNTDGEDSLQEGFTLNAQKKGHNFVVVTAGREPDDTTANNFDSVLSIKRKDQFITLTNIGKKAL